MTDRSVGMGMERARSPLFSWVALVIGALIAVALLFLAWSSRTPDGFKAQGPVGSIQAVTLVGGQIFFGTLRAEEPGRIVLGDVFGLQNNVDQQNNQRTTQIVRRRTANVHGPIDMAIPTDKILFIESVGRGSAVAEAIAKMDSAPPPGATTNPPPGATPVPPADPKN